MTKKRFKLLYSQLGNGMFVDKEKHFEDVIVDKEFQKIGLIKLVDLLNNLADENEQLKSENKRLHTKIFEMRTNIALNRTEISRQNYTGWKTEKEFLEELKKW